MFFPKKYRSHRAALIMMAIEFPFTVAILALTGIADHNTYRTKLWQDGADNGFNSSPDEAIYAAANYRPYTAPMVWSSFLTEYNLVLGVLSTFLLLTKAPMQILKVFYPPISVAVHTALIVLYSVSASFQAGKDMSDPQHPQPGPPWYITKSCSVAAHKSNIGYCNQAKSLFAVTVIITYAESPLFSSTPNKLITNTTTSVIYFSEFILAAISCFSTKAEREAYRERREEKRAIKAYEDSILRAPPSGTYPMTPGPMTGTSFPAMTPRSLAFTRLDSGSSDLPLRSHFSTPHPRSSLHLQTGGGSMSGYGAYQDQPQMYFPPPPTQAAK
ncbi:hypothetical protein Plec18167_008121 [Paecilomyces lecythidis]|uniref:Uncharacterized protein n=1 Tax=Paecilomyces lecythidis TaxID=3004212 RepID=A0ABR3WYQ2_9EURO